MLFVSQLESIKANSNLYNVYAMNAPTELKGEEVLIGTLQLDGTMLKSKWGDENLFFRHQYMSDDIDIHGEWEKYTPNYWGNLKGGCPFMNNLKK